MAVLNNLAAHKVAGSGKQFGPPEPASCIRALLAQPEPVEQVFAKLKALLRKAAANEGGALDNHWRTARQLPI